MQIIKDSIKTIVISLITLSLVTVAYAWTEPTSNPPSDNVSAPINTGSTTQYKSGLFSDEYLRSYKDAYFATDSGNVGIGTTDPKTKLDVNGPVRVGQYSAKPTCDVDTKGSIVFDTTNDKPYVCAASGVWKPLDSDGDKDGLIASFDDNDGTPKSASTVIAGAILSGYKAYGYSGGANGAWSQITGTYTPPACPVCAACPVCTPPPPKEFWTGTKWVSPGTTISCETTHNGGYIIRYSAYVRDGVDSGKIAMYMCVIAPWSSTSCNPGGFTYEWLTAARLAVNNWVAFTGGGIPTFTTTQYLSAINSPDLKLLGVGSTSGDPVYKTCTASW